MQQSEDTFSQSTATVIIIGIVAMSFYFYNRSARHRGHVKRRLSQCKKSKPIPHQNIIIALEGLGLFYLFSDSLQDNYRNINIAQTKMQAIWDRLRNFCPCFVERFNNKALRNFIKALKSIQNVKLILYTQLQAKFTEIILQQLNIAKNFDQKIYSKCSLMSPQEVDPDTRRVILITACAQRQDKSIASHHSLTLDLSNEVRQQQKILETLRVCINEVISKGDRQTLHENLHELAISKGLPIHDDH